MLNKILKLMDEKDLHCHQLTDENIREVAQLSKRPWAFLVNDTHYIMHKDKIVHVGTVKSCENFALYYKIKKELKNHGNKTSISQ